MQASDFNAWLESAVAEVLESMCFTSTCGEGEMEDSNADWVYSKLHFRGSPNGSFGIGAPLATAQTIAANFLGEDEGDMDRTQAVEVMCEIANMTCGTLLARVEPRRTFDLTTPKLDLYTEQVAGAAGGPVDRIARTFTLDDGVLHAWLEIKDPQ